MSSSIDYYQLSIYTLLSSTYCILGVPANLISLSFFLFVDKSDNISRYIFILLNSTDLFICLCFIYIAAGYISTWSDYPLVTTKTYCSVFLAVYPTAQQFSIFVTSVLCLVRTISVVRPILKLHCKTTFLLITTYLALITIRVMLLFRSEDLEVTYNPAVLRCSWWNRLTDELADFGGVSIALISLILLPSIAGCTTTIVWLHRPTRHFPLTPIKRRATITVVILTVVSLLSTLVFVVERIVRLSGGEVSPLVENMALMYAYSFTCVAHPAVYFIRLKRLQRYVRGLVCNPNSSTCGGEVEMDQCSVTQPSGGINITFNISSSQL